MVFPSLSEVTRLSPLAFKISLKLWKSYYLGHCFDNFQKSLTDQLALDWSIAFVLFLLHNWLWPSIENTAAGCHGKYSHQVAHRSLDILTPLLPPLRACLNIFSAFLHVLSYFYFSTPLFPHPQSSSLTPPPSGWLLTFLLCLRTLQRDYFNPRNLYKGSPDFPRTGNMPLWTMYVSYAVLQSFLKIHTHTCTQIQLFIGMFVVGFPDSLRGLFCCPGQMCCFPYGNCHLSKQTTTFFSQFCL